MIKTHMPRITIFALWSKFIYARSKNENRTNPQVSENINLRNLRKSQKYKPLDWFFLPESMNIEISPDLRESLAGKKLVLDLKSFCKAKPLSLSPTIIIYYYYYCLDDNRRWGSQAKYDLILMWSWNKNPKGKRNRSLACRKQS